MVKIRKSEIQNMVRESVRRQLRAKLLNEAVNVRAGTDIILAAEKEWHDFVYNVIAKQLGLVSVEKMPDDLGNKILSVIKSEWPGIKAAVSSTAEKLSGFPKDGEENHVTHIQNPGMVAEQKRNKVARNPDGSPVKVPPKGSPERKNLSLAQDREENVKSRATTSPVGENTDHPLEVGTGDLSLRHARRADMEQEWKAFLAAASGYANTRSPENLIRVERSLEAVRGIIERDPTIPDQSRNWLEAHIEDLIQELDIPTFAEEENLGTMAMQGAGPMMEGKKKMKLTESQIKKIFEMALKKKTKTGSAK